MELTLKRSSFFTDTTIGTLSDDEGKICFIVEDQDRGLVSTMTPNEIQAHKVPGKTCIPYGRYEIVITYSNRFKQQLPLLLNVQGFEGIRIHPGNVAMDTEGCLLPNLTVDIDQHRGFQSKLACELLFGKIYRAMQTEKVFINIVKA